MKINIDDIRRQYAELSDEGLLEIVREDLMDVARRCYDDELQKRGLTLEEEDEPTDRPAGEDEELVSVGNFPSPESGRLARDLVRGAGITAYLSNEYTVGANRFLSNALGGLELLVTASDERAARELLDSQVSEEMLVDLSYIRHGMGAVRPYVYGTLDLLDFVTETFHAVELERHEFSKTAIHVEVSIGDSVIVLELSDPPKESAAPCSIYVYVPDVNTVYRQALKAGGVSIDAPADKPYRDRSAGVKDPSGNAWWIATYLGD